MTDKEADARVRLFDHRMRQGVTAADFADFVRSEIQAALTTSAEKQNAEGIKAVIDGNPYPPAQPQQAHTKPQEPIHDKGDVHREHTPGDEADLKRFKEWHYRKYGPCDYKDFADNFAVWVAAQTFEREGKA